MPTQDYENRAGLIGRTLKDDERLVDYVADIMRIKLRQNRHKTHWRNLYDDELLEKLLEEEQELTEAYDGLEQSQNATTEAALWEEVADVCLLQAMRADSLIAARREARTYPAQNA